MALQTIRREEGRRRSSAAPYGDDSSHSEVDHSSDPASLHPQVLSVYRFKKIPIVIHVMLQEPFGSGNATPPHPHTPSTSL